MREDRNQEIGGVDWTKMTTDHDQESAEAIKTDITIEDKRNLALMFFIHGS